MLDKTIYANKLLNRVNAPRLKIINNFVHDKEKNHYTIFKLNAKNNFQQKFSLDTNTLTSVLHFKQQIRYVEFIEFVKMFFPFVHMSKIVKQR